MNKTYYIRKSALQDFAIDFQNDFANNCYSYADLIDIRNKLEKQAKKYGLLKEFKINGII